MRQWKKYMRCSRESDDKTRRRRRKIDWRRYKGTQVEKSKIVKKRISEVMIGGGEIFIGEIDKSKYEVGERREVTIDSAAEESVCPKAWEEQSGLREVADEKKLRLVSANGGRIEHYGEREVNFEAEEAEGGGLMGMVFQVSDVRKPLAAVWRICQKGNRVCFGPDPGDNYIQHKATKNKVMLKEKGRSYVMGVKMIRKKNVPDESFHRRA